MHFKSSNHRNRRNRQNHRNRNFLALAPHSPHIRFSKFVQTSRLNSTLSSFRVTLIVFFVSTLPRRTLSPLSSTLCVHFNHALFFVTVLAALLFRPNHALNSLASSLWRALYVPTLQLLSSCLSRFSAMPNVVYCVIRTTLMCFLQTTKVAASPRSARSSSCRIARAVSITISCKPMFALHR